MAAGNFAVMFINAITITIQLHRNNINYCNSFILVHVFLPNVMMKYLNIIVRLFSGVVTQFETNIYLDYSLYCNIYFMEKS